MILFILLLPLILGDIGIGTVTRVIDGDTLVLNNDTMRIRLALANTPERGEVGYQEATDFTKNMCLDKLVIIDLDDKQKKNSFGRHIGVVYCDFMNLNKALLDSGLAVLDKRFCNVSEFNNSAWASGCIII